MANTMLQEIRAARRLSKTAFRSRGAADHAAARDAWALLALVNIPVAVHIAARMCGNEAATGVSLHEQHLAIIGRRN